jgi:hypothetical protein
LPVAERELFVQFILSGNAGFAFSRSRLLPYAHRL